MDGEFEQYVYLYRSEDEWVLSLAPLEEYIAVPQIGRINFSQAITPAVAKWLECNLRSGVQIEAAEIDIFSGGPVLN
ncbi:MAG: putative Zn-dependent protease [Arenicella sp.]|jgi:hypothetical protein